MPGIGININMGYYNMFNPLSIDYFDRVINNGDISMTYPQMLSYNNKINALQKTYGYDNTNMDRLFAEMYSYTTIQALTPLIWNGIGTGLAVAIGSPSLVYGTGWVHNGSSYINTKFNPSVSGTSYTLNNAGIYSNFNVDTTNPSQQMVLGSSDLTNIIYNIYCTSSNIYSCINGISYNYINTIGTITSFQLKRINATTIKAKLNSLTESTSAQNSSNIPNIEVYYGAANINGVATFFIRNLGSTGFVVLGNNTLDKNNIATALAV